MPSQEDLQIAIMNTEKELIDLREEYARSLPKYRVAIVTKGKRLKSQLEDLEKTYGIYTRIEKAKEIAKEVRMKVKEVK